MDTVQPAGPGTTTIHPATAEQAMAWIKGGWELFKKAPGIWIAIVIVYILIAIVVGLIPFIGSLAMSLFAPVFTLGWLQGARDLQAGQPLRLGHLFSGFQSPRMGSLVLLGLLSLAISLGFALIAALGAFGVVAGGGMDSGPGIGALLLILLILLVILALVAAFLFATPLVGFAGLSPIDAVTLSFAATFRNWLPLLVWSLIALLLLIVGAIPFGLGLLIVGPMLSASYWLMCRDVFELPVESPAASAPTA
jgi:hypothetical protein